MIGLSSFVFLHDDKYGRHLDGCPPLNERLIARHLPTGYGYTCCLVPLAQSTPLGCSVDTRLACFCNLYAFGYCNFGQRCFTMVVIAPPVRWIKESKVKKIIALTSARGQGLAEYALILALIAILAITALMFLSGQINTILSTIGKSL